MQTFPFAKVIMDPNGNKMKGNIKHITSFGYFCKLGGNQFPLISHGFLDSLDVRRIEFRWP